MLRDFLYRLSWLRRRPKLEEDLEAELAHHLAMKQRELEREGQTEEDARFAARRSLGSVEGWKDEARDVWRFQWLESWWLDLTYSIRLLSKEKIFTCVALVTLALGIGANTAIFALLNGLLWRPLPVPHPEELVRLSVTNLPPNYQQWVNGKPVKTNERQQVTFAIYEALEKRQQVFSGMFASAGGGDMQLAIGGTPHRARVTSVTGSFFPVLGIPPQAGRLLNDQDDAPGSVAQWPAVISDELWSKLFARSPSAVGAAISIESTPFTIVGVAPASFHGISPGVETDAWIPLSSLEAIYPTFKWRADRTAWAIQPMARMRPGITAAQAGSYLASIAPAVLEDAKEPKLTGGQDEKYFVAMKFRAATASAGESWLADFYGGALWILLGAVGAVLLIAVTNLTNLFTARMASRRHEIALRLSLGASASRIRRQLLMEVAVLAIGGTLAGLIWAQWLIAAFEAAASSGNSAIQLDTSIDWRIFAFLAAILVVVMAVAGLAPAFAASRVGPQDALKKRGGGSASLRFRRGLIVLQTAFSLTLIAGAGLMLASLRGLLGDATGFQSENSVFLLPDLYNAGVSRQRNAQVDDEILMRTRELPNVVAAGWVLHIPLTGSLSNLSVEVPGRADLSVEQRTVYQHQISDGYFSAAGIPLLAGTDLPPAASRRVDICLLSENAARRFFGSAREAIGQHLKIGKDLIEVIGVVADAKYQNVREAAPPTMYVPYWSGSTVPTMALAVRYRGSFDAAYSSMQLLFQKEAGRMPYIQVSTIRGNVAESISPERLMAWLLGGFAAFALLISVVGLAGLLSYAVEQRRKELGIRLALGATPGRIRRDVQFEGLVLIALGLAAGVVLSFALRRSLNAFLYGLGAADPLIWALGIGVLLAAGAIACAIPAARAAQVDPSTMLRDE